MRARHLFVFALMGSTFLLSGCIGEVGVENMIITNQDAMKRKGHAPFSENIAVGAVIINLISHPLGHLGLNERNFREALTASLKATKLLDQDEKGLYTLNAHIVTARPGDFRFLLAVQYSLIGKHDNKKIYSKLIASEGRSGPTVASLYEEAIRNNFAMLIDKLYNLKVGQTAG